PTAPFAICGEDPHRVGLAPGRHRGTLSYHVAGAQTDPPSVSFDFSLDCAPTTPMLPEPSSAADAGMVVPIDAGPIDPSPPNGADGPGDNDAATSPGTPAGGGCRVAGPRDTATAITVIGLWLALGVIWRRRSACSRDLPGRRM
ncbi:MAG TPA: hypothetical protein VGF45_01990, partial [Polyangia bacterium]